MDPAGKYLADRLDGIHGACRKAFHHRDDVGVGRGGLQAAREGEVLDGPAPRRLALREPRAQVGKLRRQLRHRGRHGIVCGARAVGRRREFVEVPEQLLPLEPHADPVDVGNGRHLAGVGPDALGDAPRHGLHAALDPAVGDGGRRREVSARGDRLLAREVDAGGVDS